MKGQKTQPSQAVRGARCAFADVCDRGVVLYIPAEAPHEMKSRFSLSVRKNLRIPESNLSDDDLPWEMAAATVAPMCTSGP